jgi:hypothetical protein
MKFTLLEISWYGWNGISVCSFETEWDVRCLFHIEKTKTRWVFSLLFRNFFI